MGTAWENANLYERIMIRQGQLVAERNPCEDDFEQIIQVFNPGLTDFQEPDPTKKIRDTFNGTPASALRTAADGMQGSTVSRSIPWLRYQIPGSNPIFNEDDETNQWLQNVEDHMLPVYGRSAFYPSLGPYFRAALSVGTPAFISEENPATGKIECTVPHPRENYFRFDVFGVPIVYHRLFKKTVGDLVVDLKDMGIDFSALSVATNSKITSGNHGEKIEILQVYYRSDDPIFDGLTVGSENAVTGVKGDILPDRPWRTYILEMSADSGINGKKVPIDAKGYFERPHAVWRYEVSTDETYARTPAWFSLHDARGEIMASKTLMSAAEGYVRPPYFASSDMRKRIHRKPGSNTFAMSTDSFVKDMPLGGKNYPIADSERNRIVDNVERWFDVNFFLMVSRLAASGGSPPTATQLIQMGGERTLLMGTRLERLVNDMLTPIDDRFFSIELNAGRLPQPPDILLDPESGIDRIDADFIGPLLQAQRKALAVRRFLEGKGVIDEFIKTWPQLQHKIDGEALLERTLEEIGFYQAAIVPKDEFAAIMDAIAAKEQQDQQLEVGAQIADAIPKLSKSVEADSPLAQVAG